MGTFKTARRFLFSPAEVPVNRLFGLIEPTKVLLQKKAMIWPVGSFVTIGYNKWSERSLQAA
jgi:hypothetical protein